MQLAEDVSRLNPSGFYLNAVDELHRQRDHGAFIDAIVELVQAEAANLAPSYVLHGGGLHKLP